MSYQKHRMGVYQSFSIETWGSGSLHQLQEITYLRQNTVTGPATVQAWQATTRPGQGKETNSAMHPSDHACMPSSIMINIIDTANSNYCTCTCSAQACKLTLVHLQPARQLQIIYIHGSAGIRHIVIANFRIFLSISPSTSRIPHNCSRSRCGVA